MQDKRNVSLGYIKNASTEIHAYYDKSWAIVIGINDYGGRHPTLTNARNDAIGFAEVLEQKLGFENVFILLDGEATRDAIVDWLRDKLRTQVGRNDRVIFFFAGHGTTWSSIQDAETIKYGYIIPHDAEAGRYSQYIDMDELRRACGMIPAKHILIILDCCFSGVAALTSRAAPRTGTELDYDAYLREATERSARQILTAGASDEFAADSGLCPGHSAFTAVLIDGLEGDADQNNDNLITATELGAYIRQRVSRETARDGAKGQMPFFNYVAGSREGEFIFITPAGSRTRDKRLDVPPYFGLAAFSESNAEFFFGRRKVVEETLKRMQSMPRFIGLLGPSGSGKTSLIHAGIIPRLRKGAIPGSSNWDIIISRPGDRPLDELEAKGLSNASKGLADASRAWLKDHPSTTRLLLIFDQFEEFLASCPGKIREDFLGQLGDLMKFQDIAVTIIMALRDDFLDHFEQSSPAFWELSRQGFADVSPDLEESDLRSIVLEPCAKVGLELEDGLVDAIVGDVLEVSPGEKPRTARCIVFPLLQSAMTRVWEKRHADGKITHKAYGDTGKLSGELPVWAEQTFEKLSMDGLGPLARRILIDLVNLGDVSQKRPDTGRRMTMNALCHGEEEEKNAVHRVVQKMADARLLATSSEKKNREVIVELIDDSLIQRWDKLRQWLHEDRGFLLWRRGAENYAHEWMKATNGGQTVDEERLLSGQGLMEAERWLKERGRDLGKREKKYIQFSLDHREDLRTQKEKDQREREQNKRKIIQILAVFSIVTLIIAAYAFYLKDQTEEMGQEEFALLTAYQSSSIKDVPYEFIHSIMLAVQSMNYKTMRVGRHALQDGLELLPTPLARLNLGGSTFIDKHLRLISGDLEFSPDGTIIATATSDNIVRIWDGVTGKGRINMTHDGAVSSVAFSPNSSWIVTASSDKTARVWDIATGKEVANMLHNDTVNSAVFSPNGSWIVTASSDKTARVWDIATGKVLANISHDDAVHFAVFSPDGNRIATASDDKTSIIWDIPTGKETARLVHYYWVNFISFSPDGARVVTASKDSTARIWNASNGDELAKLKHDSDVCFAVFSPDGSKVATASDDHTARIWDALTGTEIARMEHDYHVNSIAFSPDGNRVATASGDGTARIWDAVTGIEIARMEHIASVKFVAFSPDGTRLVTGSDDGTAIIWKAPLAKDLFVMKHAGEASSIRFSPDGSRVVTASIDGTAGIWNALNGKELARLHHYGTVYFAVFSSDGTRVVTACFDGIARIWNASSGEELARMEHDGAVLYAIFSRDATRVTTAGWDGTARIWNASNGQELARLKHNGTVYSAIFSRDASRVVTACEDGAARIWNASNGEELVRLKHDGAVTLAIFSPDATRIATASGDGTARIWNASSGEELARIVHGGRVKYVDFSPDGCRLVTASEAKTARISNALNGTKIAQISLEGPVNKVIFSSDGTRVLTASDDKTATIWDAANGTELDRSKENSMVNSVDFSPDGTRFAIACSDGTAKIKTIKSWNLVCEACSRLTCNLTSDEWREMYCSSCHSQ